MRRNEIGFLIVFVAVLFYVFANPTGLGLPASLSDDLFGILPGLLVTFFSIKGYKDSRGEASSIALVGLGIGLALFAGTAYDLGLVSSVMLSGLSVAQLQTWVIVFSVILAGIDYYRH